MKRLTRIVLTTSFALFALAGLATSATSYLIGDMYASAILAMASAICFLILLECIKIKVTDGVK